jgi:hypothetical protein
MLLLQAPYGSINTAIALPNPQLNDTETRDQSVTPKRTMNGLTYTYVKSSNNFTFNFLLRLSRNKSLELRTFVLQNQQEEIMVGMDWREEVWRMRLINNPIEILTQAHDETCFAEVDVTLQFEGTQIS